MQLRNCIACKTNLKKAELEESIIQDILRLTFGTIDKKSQTPRHHKEIGLKAGIQIYGTGDRQWMFVVCDGLPFGLCKEVIAQTLRCRTCDRSEDSFHGQDQFLQHHNNCHSEIPYTEKCQLKEFQWVILRPGNGHIEMNMMKSFTSLNWDVFMDELAKLMGFCSENAQKAAKNCTDNHKDWTIIETAYEGK
ncbi:unnamed protein product [Mytilus coruscus]|uniref:Uncharacterized protein n=1 Tax=Mytilus coruscus TaxID=42192 RepID=A0A6J8AN59_MYTCO|nr:unnamed protein product [Mytilus coruscus]